MQRSWLVWAASAAALAITAIVIVALMATVQMPVEGHQDGPLTSTLRASKGYQAGYQSAKAQSDSRPDIRLDIWPNGRFNSQPVQVGSENARVFSKSVIDYQPPEQLALAHPSNYGERLTVDADGNPLNNKNIVVLHETVGSASSAINLFRTNHPNDNDQISYHTLIGLDGTVYYIVPPEQRAFGAGNSSFKSAAGEESVFTNPDFPSSVNNFAYHISLETPSDGMNSNANHSGYTAAQYQSLAWLIARSTVPDSRITTHKAVDRSGSRADPRSFERQRLLELLNQYPDRPGLE